MGDYRNLKKNWGLGKVFGRIKDFDSETKEEKVLLFPPHFF